MPFLRYCPVRRYPVGSQAVFRKNGTASVQLLLGIVSAHLHDVSYLFFLCFFGNLQPMAIDAILYKKR